MSVPRLLLHAGVVAGFCLVLVSCSPKEHDAVVAKIGDTPITLRDYERLYTRSSGTQETGAATSQSEREKFLDLMVKYRLKLTDAYAAQLDRRPDVVSELEQYKGSLAASYATEREVNTPGLRKLYNQRNEEVRASHILISLAPNASPEDSAAAYAKAFDVIGQLKGGADFAPLAKQYSQDPSAQTNGGDLYYFTAGQMVPPFEEAVFAMKPGEISSTPVRTNYGLHVIKVFDRKPAEGERSCSHIMVRLTSPNPSPEDTAAAYQKIKTLEDSLKAGADFAGLAMRQSGDPGSAPKGGDLGWFGRRRWPMPFDEVAFTLKPGQISPIVRTTYGYHLIKCNEVRPPKSFDEAKPEIQRVYQQLRFPEEYATYINRMKTELNYVRDTTVTARLFSLLDTTKSTRDSAWASGITPELGTSTLLTINGRKMSVDSVIAAIQRRPELGNIPLRPSAFISAIDKVGEQALWAAKADQMAKTDPTFADIMHEYRDGILLYQVEQERVWNNIALNDTVLREYFDAHREDFRFPERLRFTTIRTATSDQAQKVASLLREGQTIEEIVAADSVRMAGPIRFQVTFGAKRTALSAAAKKTLDEVAAALQGDPSVKVMLATKSDTLAPGKQLKARRLDAIKSYLTTARKIENHRIIIPPADGQGIMLSAADSIPNRVILSISGRNALIVGRTEQLLLAADADERAAHADSLQVGSVSAPFAYKGTQMIVRLDAREPARLKTFEEASAEVSSAYQETESKRLENAWLDGLRAKYKVVEHREVLKNAFGQAQ